MTGLPLSAANLADRDKCIVRGIWSKIQSNGTFIVKCDQSKNYNWNRGRSDLVRKSVFQGVDECINVPKLSPWLISDTSSILWVILTLYPDGISSLEAMISSAIYRHN